MIIALIAEFNTDVESSYTVWTAGKNRDRRSKF
jgi:hypothetical protein